MIHKIKNFIKNNRLFFIVVKKIYNLVFPIFPYSLRKEKKALINVLKSQKWNMSHGEHLVHHLLEKEFAEYIGVKHAIAVNTGGMAIQMSLRALNLQYNDEVIHQIDTCIANPFAILNANVTPVFSDISEANFHLNFDDLEKQINENTKVIMPIHIWGYPENMENVLKVAKKYNLIVIEDCALALGAEYNGQKVGSIGDFGIFSFGSGKPIQAGEGGMITTNDDNLAKKLRTIRNWGEMSFEYGVRDHEILSWNGRMSEFVAAIALEQLRAYPKFLSNVQNNINKIKRIIEQINGLSVVEMANSNPSYMQLIIKIEDDCKLSKSQLFTFFESYSIAVWHANFEPIISLRFYKDDKEWRKWIMKDNCDKISQNYKRDYITSNKVYNSTGLGFMRNNFISYTNTLRLTYVLKKLMKEIN